ncbi:MAG TPA: hypothetical protein VKT73_13125 [Xanthobacteraceae bacterium]|nr:hypothetical protein [Xanthobacteraceae bacterium]
MAVKISSKVEVLDRDIKLLFPADLSDAARSEKIADYAEQVFESAEAQNEAISGVKPQHKIFVDGAQTEDFHAVKPDGTIVIEFELVDDLFQWIDSQLIAHSPVKSGRYGRGHRFYADGIETDVGGAIPNASQYAFVNVEPYARKIESGESAQAPEGVYEVVAALAAQRYGSLAKIRFTYQSVIGGDTDLAKWASVAKQTRRGLQSRKSKSDLERNTRNPAILITVK